MQHSSLTHSGPVGQSVRRARLIQSTTRNVVTSPQTSSTTSPPDSVNLSSSRGLINNFETSSQTTYTPHSAQSSTYGSFTTGASGQFHSPGGSGSLFAGHTASSTGVTAVGPNGSGYSLHNQSFTGIHGTMTSILPNGAATSTSLTAGHSQSSSAYSHSGPGHTAHGQQQDFFTGVQLSQTQTQDFQLANLQGSHQVTNSAQAGVSGNGGYNYASSADGVVANGNFGFNLGASVSQQHSLNLENDSGDSVQLTGGYSYGPGVSFDADAGIDTSGDETTLHFNLGGNVLGGGSVGGQVTISDETVQDAGQAVGSAAGNITNAVTNTSSTLGGVLGTAAGATMALFREGGGSPPSRHNYSA